MDILGWGLLAWAVVSLVLLGAIEAAAALTHKPTISDRVRELGRSAPIVVLWAMFLVGYLAAHFWDHS